MSNHSKGVKEIGPPPFHILLHMTVVSSMWCLNPRVVSRRWRDVHFSGPWWLLHCVWLCNLAKVVQTQLWNVIRASRPEERGLGTKSGLKAETWSNPHPHTEEMCHIALSHLWVSWFLSFCSMHMNAFGVRHSGRSVYITVP